MDEHPNAKRLRELADGPDEAWDETWSDDIVWHMIGQAEPIRGKAALLGTESNWEKVDQKVHDVLSNDEHGVVLIETTARRNGRTLTYRTAEIYHWRGDKISERWAFADDTEAITRFFA